MTTARNIGNPPTTGDARANGGPAASQAGHRNWGVGIGCLLVAAIGFGCISIPKEPKPGAEQVVDLGGGVKLTLCWCPAGSFTMGSPNDETNRFDNATQHRVTLTKGFWMGKTEVTQAQWTQVMGSNPSHFKGANLPVETVSWNVCQEFVSNVNAFVTSGGFRLPTEAEWEYACRAGTTGPYAGNLDEMAWYSSNSGNKTHEVGQKNANTWNLYDMHGNVWEWCSDWYWYADYPSGKMTDQMGPSSARVFRGGNWFFDGRLCRSAYRNRLDPDYRDSILGLRLVRTPP